MSFTTEACITFKGEDYVARVEFTVTDWGSKPIVDYVFGGDPGWGPEWEIDEIFLRQDTGDDNSVEFKATGADFADLCENDRIDDAIYTRVSEMEWEGI